MARCQILTEIGRRQFLKGSGAVTAGAVAGTVVAATPARAAFAPARVTYPSNRLANLAELEVDVPFEVAYPDADAPGVLLKLGRPVPGGVGPDGDVVGFTTLCPHKGYPLQYDASDRTLNCPGHYSRFDPEKDGLQVWGHATQNLPRYALRVDDEGRRPRRGRGRAALRPPQQRARVREDETMAYKRNVDRLPIIPADATEHNVVCHYCIVGCGYKAYSWDVNRQGGTAPGENKFGVDLAQQQEPETPAWYAPSMYNIVRQDGRDVHLVDQARQGLRGERGPGLDPRRPDGRDVLLDGPQHAAAAADRSPGLALRPAAADELGRRARSGGPGHRRGDQGAGRGRAVRLGLRPRRRRRRLREHLGHRQALLRCDEGEEHPHPQPPGLQLRGPRHPRHGRGRAQQLLRGRRARRHDRGGRHQRARDPDQLLPRPLGAEPARHVARTRSGPSCRTSRTSPAGSSSSTRGAP